MATEYDYTDERLAEYEAAAIAQNDVIVMGFVTVVRGLRERVRRMQRLLRSAAANLDRHMPDGAGARAVLTSQMRDAVDDKWDEGEWDDDDGYRLLG